MDSCTTIRDHVIEITPSNYIVVLYIGAVLSTEVLLSIEVPHIYEQSYVQRIPIWEHPYIELYLNEHCYI